MTEEEINLYFATQHADTVWRTSTRFGSGLCRFLVERMFPGQGLGWPGFRLDYGRLAQQTEFTENEIVGAVAVLVHNGHIRREDRAGAVWLVPLCPSTAAVDELNQQREEERAPRPPRPQRAAIPTVVKARVYARDGFACVTCGATEDLTLDHIVPWSAGGPDTEENLRLLCRSCNSRKGART